MDLNAVVLFARVVDTGSFTAAARSLRLPKSTVSRKIAELEDALGARLVHRTTRKMGLTDAGRLYYGHCSRIVSELKEGEEALGNMQSAPQGLLRVTAPLSFSLLGPDVASFLVKYPEVQIELVCTDRRVDLVEENFDVAIRAGALADSSLVARSLGSLQSVLVASPAYCQQHGTPRTAAELAQHACLSFGSGPSPRLWTLCAEGDQQVDVPISPRLIVNDFEMMGAAARAGVGIAWMMASTCADDLAAGRLQRVLPSYGSRATPLHAVYPSVRHLSPKVSAFIAHLRATFSASNGRVQGDTGDVGAAGTAGIPGKTFDAPDRRKADRADKALKAGKAFKAGKALKAGKMTKAAKAASSSC